MMKFMNGTTWQTMPETKEGASTSGVHSALWSKRATSYQQETRDESLNTELSSKVTGLSIKIGKLRNQIEEENGFGNDADAWTGSTGVGLYNSGETCSDWTSTSGIGTGTEADGYQIFKEETGKPCSSSYAVQCVKVEDQSIGLL